MVEEIRTDYQKKIKMILLINQEAKLNMTKIKLKKMKKSIQKTIFKIKINY